jgi:adenylate kinase
MRIVLLGLPGAGKGTLGQKLATTLGVPHLSLGDCVRDTLKKDNPLSLELKATLSVNQRWQPLNDELAHRVFLQFAAPDCIVDGFPRNVEQLKLLDPQQDDRFIYLEISEAESCDRVLRRNRSDDALIIWRQRIEFERQRLPQLVEKSGASVVSGEGDADDIFDEILRHVFYMPWKIQLSQTDAIYSPYCEGIAGDSPVMLKIGDEHFLAPTETQCSEFWELFTLRGYPKIKRCPEEWAAIRSKVLAVLEKSGW